jgi:hypothetical protein
MEISKRIYHENKNFDISMRRGGPCDGSTALFTGNTDSKNQKREQQGDQSED